MASPQQSWRPDDPARDGVGLTADDSDTDGRFMTRRERRRAEEARGPAVPGAPGQPAGSPFDTAPAVGRPQRPGAPPRSAPTPTVTPLSARRGPGRPPVGGMPAATGPFQDGSVVGYPGDETAWTLGAVGTGTAAHVASPNGATGPTGVPQRPDGPFAGPTPSPRNTGRGRADTRSGAAKSGGKPPQSIGQRLLRDAREVLGTVAVALGIAIVIKTFLVQPFKIPSESMEDTLLVGDRVLVSKLQPGPLPLHRGDVVVFLDPGGWLETVPPDQSVVNQALTFVGLLPANSGKHLIKRIIGLPGDTVTCCDADGRMLVNNQPLDETVYLYPNDQPSGEDFEVTVPEGRIWVMGDHRSVSRDSRFHEVDGDLSAGAVPLENVVGRAVLVSWPLIRWDWLGRPEGVFDGVAGLDGVT